MQVIVDAAQLKRMFRELKPVLRNASDGGLLGMSLRGNVLTVTCKNGLIYQRRFATDSSGTAVVTVLYRDLSELLPSDGIAVVLLSDKAVMISTPEFTTTLQAAYGEVTPYRQRCESFKQIQAAKLNNLASMFASLAPVSRTMKSESSVLLTSEVAICKYPSIWLEVPFTDFATSIGVRELRTIANFGPRSVGISGDAIEFKNDAALLAVPITQVGVVKTCTQILRSPEPEVKIANIDIAERAASFARSVSGACKLTFCADGYILSYRSNNVEMSCNIGDVSAPIYTLDTYTEYLQMIFKLIAGEQAYLTKAQNAVMLSVPGKLRLLFATI